MMSHIPLTVVLALTIAAAGCTKRVDIEKVPVGTEVEVTRQDGGVVHGTLAARDDRTVKVKAGPVSHTVPRAEIAEVQLVDDATPVALPAIATFRAFTLPAGTRLALRLDSPVGSESSRVEDQVDATLTDAVFIDGTEVLPAGSVVRGAVTAVQSAGKVKGRGSLALGFSVIAVPEHDKRYPISAHLGFEAPGSKGKETATIAVPAGAGAIIGGIVGGKKGAVIGGAIGGGAGTAVVLSTRGPQVDLPRGSLLSLSLDQPLDVRVPIVKT